MNEGRIGLADKANIKAIYKKGKVSELSFILGGSGPQLEVSAIPVQPVERIEQAQVAFPLVKKYCNSCPQVGGYQLLH